MSRTYSTDAAKAHFSEILRQVRAGERIVVTHHGKEMAEIRPPERRDETFEQRLEKMELEGTIVPAKKPPRSFEPLARRPGALQRFLDSRH